MRCLSLLLLALAATAVRADEYVPAPAKAAHWAWQAPVRPPVPVPADKGWVRNPVDAFVLAEIEKAGLRPAAPATREQLIRRATFDLIGLPPTPAEIAAFTGDSTADAWEKVIERLLASPHYGERWGRHWLDLVRFADSNGYEMDETRLDAWRYRDYVIDAFNNDKPYDRFVQEQIAGDELFPDSTQARIATGFNLLGPDMTDAADQRQRRQNMLDDMTDTTGLVFLGMTIGCARCHDHKFEPIPQTDFYRLQAFFAAALFRKDVSIAQPDEIARHLAAEKEYRRLVQPITSAIAKIEQPYRQKLYESRFQRLAEAAQVAQRLDPAQRSPEQQALVEKTARLLLVTDKEVTSALSKSDRDQVQQLNKELQRFAGKKPSPLPVAMGLEDGAKPVKTVLLVRGQLGHPGEEVQPGFPLILSPGFKTPPATARPSTPAKMHERAELAHWLTANDNPLAARVMVNRLWQHHFGRGIVATPNDLGIRGAPPSHPELLDWLAREFADTGWSVKRLHKLLLLSAAYQQSTQASKDTLAKDPGNKLFSRMNRLRLEGEVVRDSLLAISDRLNPKIGGPGVFPPLPPEVAIRDWKVNSDTAEHRRRSVYIFAKRNLHFPFLEAFDLPDTNQSCPQRDRTTTAPQALALLNSAEVSTAAQALADRVTNDAPSLEERIRLTFRLALGRNPSPQEQIFAQEFLTLSPLSELCRTMFNINEFVYLD